LKQRAPGDPAEKDMDIEYRSSNAPGHAFPIDIQYFQIPRTISRESFRPSTLAPAGILRCAMLTPDAQRIFKNYDANNCRETT